MISTMNYLRTLSLKSLLPSVTNAPYKAARADRAIPFGRTNCFGLLPDLVGTVRPDLRIRIVGRYRFQQVYEIATADSGWLLS